MAGSRFVKRLAIATPAVVVIFLAGVFVGRWSAARDAPEPQSVQETSPRLEPLVRTTQPVAVVTPPVKLPNPPVTLLDSNSEDVESALDAAFTHWFTAPGCREKALRMLVDPMAGPFDGSNPPLKQVYFDTKNLPGRYAPKIPGVPTVVEKLMDHRTGWVPGEMSVWVDRLAVQSDGTVIIEFGVANHGYLSDDAVYLVRKTESGWQARYIGMQ
jgi:hypothetical protein